MRVAESESVMLGVGLFLHVQLAGAGVVVLVGLVFAR